MNRIVGLIFFGLVLNLNAQTKIPKRGFAVDWIVPAVSSNPTVKTFDRIELGINLPDSLLRQITDFLNESKEAKTLNPFNKKEIEIYAEFRNDSIGILKRIKANYHEDFLLNRNPDSLKKSKTKFRIHFYPNFIGKWKFIVTIKLNGIEITNFGEYGFTCERRGDKRAIIVDQEKIICDSLIYLMESWNEIFHTSRNLRKIDFYSFENYKAIKYFCKDIDFANFKSASKEKISKNKRVRAIISTGNKTNTSIGMIENFTYCGDKRIFKAQYSSNRKSQIQIEDLKKQKMYSICWYNPFSIEIISTGKSKTSKSGKMILNYPTLTNEIPFYAFKILEEN